jgi:glycosyltransferase involved in cell wall biosynthesis
MPPDSDARIDIRPLIASMLDPDWYVSRYPDVVVSELDAVAHFQQHGAPEGRDPNRFFDSTWYAKRYPDVAASRLNPITHYLRSGAAALLDPHPMFDAAWYVQQHPEAAANPVLYHLRTGLARSYKTAKPTDIRDYLPSENSAPNPPPGVFVDVIVPTLSGLREARRCLGPVLSGRTFPIARVIVFDHNASDRALSAWLDTLAADGEIHLIRDRRRMSPASCIGRGIDAAETHDVVLLPGDIAMSPDTLRRLSAHAFSAPRIATVSALSDTRTTPAHSVFSFGRPTSELEETCRTVNAGRSVQIPAPTGSCLYIRRDALRATGDLTKGPDAIADFCRRATAAGWQHRLGLDTFAGRDPADPSIGRELGACETPNERDRSINAADPFRFAVTAALFRRSGLPVILMVSHNLGGGIRRHINSLAERYVGRAHVLLLAGTDRGATLSVPLTPDHPVATLPPENIAEMVVLLRAAGVTRVHIHHLLYQGMDIRRLIYQLGVPFDLTVHDYYAICPQVNLLRWPEGLYCQEPDRAGCNRCIAEFSSHHAREILSWRQEQQWQFIQADRVICPSEDVKARMSRYGASRNALVAPHEDHPAGPWPVALPALPASPLRIVLLGVLANHKGARIVASVAEAAEPGSLAFHLIGHLEPWFPAPAIKYIDATGKYQEHELDTLLDKAAPHVFWFPSTAPETYSYTLTTAIETGLPIVATRLGSFPERLAGRPNTWLVDYDATTQDWLAVFDQVQNRLRDPSPAPRVPRPAPVSDFYDKGYLTPKSGRAPARVKPRIALLAERHPDGALTPNAYIRLLQPLDHPAIGNGFELLLVDVDTVYDSGADIVVTQRNAIPDVETADRISAYVRRGGGALVFDLDDDLLNVPAHHPQAGRLRARAQGVRQMLTVADAIWLATPGLADKLFAIRPDAIVIEDRLDERIWTAPPPLTPYWDDPIRILYLSPASQDDDLAMILPVLTRLKADYGERISIDVLGMIRPRNLPHGINGIGPSPSGSRSYPGFVDWMTRSRPVWHIGIAPLPDTPVNRSRSPVKALTYAAIGLAVVASDVPAYRGSLADGPAGQLVPNDPVAWHASLDWLIRGQDLRRRFAVQARDAFVTGGSLASVATQRVAALQSLQPTSFLRDAAVALTIPHDQSHSAPRTRRHSGRGR